MDAHMNKNAPSENAIAPKAHQIRAASSAATIPARIATNTAKRESASSLMLGCFAEAESAELAVDAAELEEARWFSRDALRAVLAARSGEPVIPPPFAIAHHLIRAWVETDAGAGPAR